MTTDLHMHFLAHVIRAEWGWRDKHPEYPGGWWYSPNGVVVYGPHAEQLRSVFTSSEHGIETYLQGPAKLLVAINTAIGIPLHKLLQEHGSALVIESVVNAEGLVRDFAKEEDLRAYKSVFKDCDLKLFNLPKKPLV